MKKIVMFVICMFFVVNVAIAGVTKAQEDRFVNANQAFDNCAGEVLGNEFHNEKFDKSTNALVKFTFQECASEWIELESSFRDVGATDSHINEVYNMKANAIVQSVQNGRFNNLFKKGR